MNEKDEVGLARRMLTALVEQSRFADCILDKPEDRLYHAEDKTWWKREGNRLVCADPPIGRTIASTVPDRPGWWWRYGSDGWFMTSVTILPSGGILWIDYPPKDDGLWGGPVMEPGWIPDRKGD
jgi:hypothetical protein